MTTNNDLTVNKNENAVADKSKIRNWMSPSVDIFENDEGLTLIADIPGVPRDRLNLGIEKEILTIEAVAGESDYGYHRRFQLPEHLDLEHVSAEMKHGVLTVHLPKAAAAKPRKIAVTVH